MSLAVVGQSGFNLLLAFAVWIQVARGRLGARFCARLLSVVQRGSCRRVCNLVKQQHWLLQKLVAELLYPWPLDDNRVGHAIN